MVKERKNICILGAGKMGLEYSNILRSKRYKIFAASSSSSNSKSWTLFKKKNPEAIYLNNDEILNFPVTWALSNWTWDGNPLSIGKSALDSAVAAPALALASGMSWASGE